MLKKSMDILDVYAWASRYAGSLQGCFIDNIYRSKSYWILKARCTEGLTHIKVEPGVRVHFSQSIPEEKGIDAFTRFLRSRVRDSRVTLVKQPWWERLLLLETTLRGVVLRHYIEIVPRGLWVIADTSDRIVYSTKFTEFKDRVIKPLEAYKPPPLKNPPPWSREQLLRELEAGRDLVRTVVSAWGLPGYIAEELLYRAGLLEVKNTDPKSIPRVDLERLASEYELLASEAGRGAGYLVYGDSTLELYTSYKPLLFSEVYDKSVKTTGDLNTAIDAYFTEYEALLEHQRRIEEASRALREAEERVRRQEELIAEYRRELEELEHRLQVIYSNYTLLEEVLECARSTREAKGWDYITRECRHVAGVAREKGAITVSLDGELVELSLRVDLGRQVIELEKKKGELKKKIEVAAGVLEEMKRRMEEASGSIIHEEKTIEKPSPVFWYERFHWLYTRSGLLAIGGRDQSQNEVIVRKYLGESDVFIHADVHGGSAVVLKSSGRHSIEDVVDAACIAACYSKAWKAGFSYIEVFWVPGSQVSKTPPSGEYLPRGAFMVYGSKNYLRIPLKLAVGVRLFSDEVYGEYVKVIVGPEELLKGSSIAYAILAPGDKSPSEVAGILGEFFEKTILECKGVRYRVPRNEIESRIPGASRILGLYKQCS
ncbi:MAG: ribosome rescue protein RqcH [Desulfurococcus sp.]|nr:ribosome rescue protein RqcH [Desulfurococcus sp.]